MCAIGGLNVLLLLCLEGTKGKLFRVSSLCPYKDTELKWRNKLFPRYFALKFSFRTQKCSVSSLSQQFITPG